MGRGRGGALKGWLRGVALTLTEERSSRAQPQQVTHKRCIRRQTERGSRGCGKCECINVVTHVVRQSVVGIGPKRPRRRGDWRREGAEKNVGGTEPARGDSQHTSAGEAELARCPPTCHSPPSLRTSPVRASRHAVSSSSLVSQSICLHSGLPSMWWKLGV